MVFLQAFTIKITDHFLQCRLRLGLVEKVEMYLQSYLKSVEYLLGYHQNKVFADIKQTFYLYSNDC